MELHMKVDNTINLQSLSVIHRIMNESSPFSTDSGINTIKEE